jgi:hypothetical protein
LERGYPATIATMSDPEAKLLRKVYDQVFCATPRATSEEGTQADITQHVWLDTNPQHLTDLGILLRLFPDARFVYVIRHPLDVVLSCFMQNFRYANFTANFVSVERAAETYHRMFTLWRATVRQFPHACRILRYEELVAAPDETLGELKEWLGWVPNGAAGDGAAGDGAAGDGAAGDDAVAQPVTTPSYHQVIRPIYSTAAGRWRSYESHLQVARDIVAPWLEYFGYED